MNEKATLVGVIVAVVTVFAVGDCADPPSSETAECVDEVLAHAETCLADEAQCAEWAVQTAEGFCNITPI